MTKSCRLEGLRIGASICWSWLDLCQDNRHGALVASKEGEV